MSKFCGNCGANIEDNEAKICGYCGYRFFQTSATQPTISQAPVYQQVTNVQPQNQVSYGTSAYAPASLTNKQSFSKSKIFLAVAALLQLYATIVYFLENIGFKYKNDKELISFFEYMDNNGGGFLIIIPIVIGVIALILNVLSLCLKKFGGKIKQIPQIILALLNFCFYTYLVFVLRDDIGYGSNFKRYLKEMDVSFSDGWVTMIIVTVAIIALMITAAVFYKKEKKVNF